MAFNTRRDIFADPRLREALAMMFDFEWINANLFDGLFTRTKSFFDQSELSSAGRPASAAERALLAPFPGAVRDDILEGRWTPPVADGSGRDRDIARRALALAEQAGWRMEDGALRRDGARAFVRDHDADPRPGAHRPQLMPGNCGASAWRRGCGPWTRCSSSAGGRNSIST